MECVWLCACCNHVLFCMQFCTGISAIIMHQQCVWLCPCCNSKIMYHCVWLCACCNEPCTGSYAIFILSILLVHAGYTLLRIDSLTLPMRTCSCSAQSCLSLSRGPHVVMYIWYSMHAWLPSWAIERLAWWMYDIDLHAWNSILQFITYHTLCMYVPSEHHIIKRWHVPDMHAPACAWQSSIT